MQKRIPLSHDQAQLEFNSLIPEGNGTPATRHEYSLFTN